MIQATSLTTPAFLATPSPLRMRTSLTYGPLADRRTLFTSLLYGRGQGQPVCQTDRQTIIRHSNWICLGVCRETKQVVDMLREGSRNTRNLGPSFSADLESPFLFPSGNGASRSLDFSLHYNGESERGMQAGLVG